ncbi:MAG TPA: hypothetical protein VGG16_03175 [Streptosporangiaceae bacterium]
MPCGQGTHPLRWDTGIVQLPSHPDAEAELVLAALGGEKPGCVRLAEIWARHTDDLSVLGIWPRSAEDRVTVDWDSIPEPQAAGQSGWTTLSGGAVPHSSGRQPPGRQAMQAEIERTAQRTTDVLSLLALGPGFQMRLSGHVAAAQATLSTTMPRPALETALIGRIALVAEKWIGIDPDQVKNVTLHTGEGWGSSRMSGRGEERELAFSLPASWLASVWACGLALAGRQLVVAVTRAGWPDAQVLALRAPGAEPALLDVHGTADADGSPVWEAAR